MSGKNEILRLGLIGAGPWGRNFINTIDELDGVTLARLASRNPESARLVGPGCEIHLDWREMIQTNDLDGVIVATPPALHAEMTLAAVDRDLPVMVEKPLTLDVGEAEAVLDRARSIGAIVLVDHIHLYSAAWEALKREAVRLGPIRAIAAKAGRWGPARYTGALGLAQSLCRHVHKPFGMRPRKRPCPAHGIARCRKRQREEKGRGAGTRV